MAAAFLESLAAGCSPVIYGAQCKDQVMPRSWGKPAAGEPIVPKNRLKAKYWQSVEQLL